ncbi:MAG: HD domain-containing protein [Oscillospiraceae bacterium]|nr:HD domain-containing protein [Oscillospiraceae bacterium]
MKLDLTDMLYALSFALDKVETELLGLDTGHCRRVACLGVLMGKGAGFEEEELRDFVGCCILHDNALTEFIHEELMSQEIAVQVSAITGYAETKMHHRHCTIGERNIRLLPFRTDVKDIILYHHENADGTGALKKNASETTLKSQILHLADIIDMKYRLTVMTEQEFNELREWVRSQSGKLFSEKATELFLQSVDFENISYLQDKGVLEYLHEEMQTIICDYSDEEIHNIADLFAKIVDYKSEFTQSHSRGVADKAEFMANYYGFDKEKAIRYYFAGAMHDIGKLVVSNDILEKPGKLTADEFTEMKNHAAATYYVLSQIKDIPDILEWASNHHEKLNGKGYPRGLPGDKLSFEEQLMACIDIYQALTEKRPYKDGMSHEKTISIMMEMAGNGELNEKIVHDMDTVMMTSQ